MTPKKIKIALIQLAPMLGDLKHNLEKHLSIISDTRKQNVDVVIFPELSLTGYFLRDLVNEVAITEHSKELNALSVASRDIDIIVGCVLENREAKFYNVVIYLSRGKITHIHRKVYLPTYGLFDEMRYFATGDKFRAFDMNNRWRAGILVCEDMWHPSAALLLSKQQLELFFCPSASPARGVTNPDLLGTEHSYDAITRTYAQLFTTYVIYCNRVGYEDGVSFWGGSRVVGPDGTVIGDVADAQEQVITRVLDFGEVRRARIATPLLRDERYDIK